VEDDGDSPLPWIGGGIALLAGGGLVLVRRRR
jgi:LPXTG-motif cell wall-anchored protein